MNSNKICIGIYYCLIYSFFTESFCLFYRLNHWLWKFGYWLQSYFFESFKIKIIWWTMVNIKFDGFSGLGWWFFFHILFRAWFFDWTFGGVSFGDNFFLDWLMLVLNFELHPKIIILNKIIKWGKWVDDNSY